MSRKPYIYIIQHKYSGLKYIGAKWGEDANPDTFMQDIKTGYLTSSDIVIGELTNSRDVIFSILEIIEEHELQTPWWTGTVEEYERWFIKFNNCAMNDSWMNLSSYVRSHTSDEYKRNLFVKYGVTHAMKSPEVYSRYVQCLQLKYGVDNQFQREDIKDRIKNSNIQNYGVENPMHRPDIKEKVKLSRKTKYGYDYSLQVPEIKEKFKNTCISNLGYEYPMMSQKIRNKSIESCKALYGENVTNVQQVEWCCPQCQIKGRGLNKFAPHKMHPGANHQKGKYWDLRQSDPNAYKELIDSVTKE